MMSQQEYVNKHNLHREWVKKYVELPDELKDEPSGNVNCDIDVFTTIIAQIGKRLKQLNSVRNIRLVQEWTGYEECNIYINYEQYETEQEFSERVQHQYDEWTVSEKMRGDAIEERNEEYKKELEKLNLKYGKS